MDGLCNEVIKQLHRTDKSDVCTKTHEIEKAKFTKEEFFDIYKLLAHEAFLYGAESGSENTIRWILTCFYKMSSLVENKNKVLILLLDCGFTLYNSVLDVKGRYGRGKKTKNTRDYDIQDYKRKVKAFSDDSAIPQEAKRYLDALNDLIEFANCTSTHKEAEDMKKKVLGYLNKGIPKFISALLKYHLGLDAFAESDAKKEEKEKAREYLQSAHESLKIYMSQNTSPSAYCFNVIHGKY